MCIVRQELEVARFRESQITHTRKDSVNRGHKMKKLTIFIQCLTLAMATSAFALDIHPAKEDVKQPKKEYSPYVEDHFPNRVYFGDTHLHTSWSTDAGMA
ncbi:hypothetical protein LCGC14_2785850, partial [marine sediment metagenome]